MKDKMLLFKQTLGHFCVDACCAAVVISGTYTIFDAVKFFVLYNFLAFCLQPLAGILLDKFKKIDYRRYILSSFILLLLGFIPDLNIWVRVVLVGIANCLFHVGGGTIILTESKNKLAPLGIFVSSGAVGLMLGTMFANSIICHALLIIALIELISMNIKLPKQTMPATRSSIHLGVAALLCLCVVIRSFMGFMPLTTFTKAPWIIVMITLCVFLGKSLGGILCDRFGIRKTVIVSTIFVLGLFLLSFNNPYLWSIVQVIVNLSMPITLYLMYKSMPKYPAFSFGLAAACLVFGLLATLPVQNLGIPAVYLLGLFVINSVLILYAERKLK